MSSKMNMVIKGVAGDDIYGEASAVEIHFTEEDSTDLYVLCSMAAGDYIYSVSHTSHLPIFHNDAADAEKAEKQIVERYEFMIDDGEPYDNLRESAYYKAFDLATYILRNADWTSFDASVAQLSEAYIDKNIDDVECTDELDDLLADDDE